MIFLRLFIGCLSQLLPFCYLCFYPFHNCFRFSNKKAKPIAYIIILISSLVFSITGTYISTILNKNYFLFQMVNIIFMFCLLPCIFYYFYIIKDFWQKKLFIFTFTITSALTITSICNMLSTLVYLDKQSTSDGLPYRGYTTLIIITVTAVILPFLILLLKKVYLPIKDELNKSECGQLSILSCFLFIVLASGLSFINFNYLFENPMTLFLFFSLILSVFIIYFLYFKIYFSVHEKYIAENKYIKIQYDMQLLNEQYQQFNQKIEASRKIKHDFKHHIITIQSCLDKNEIDKAQNYIQQYLKDIQQYDLLKFCDHQVINILVSYYYTLAKEQQIDFVSHINIPAEIPIANSDISVLLGNLLENAVTAANLSNNATRHIYLNIMCHRKMLAITVDNSFNGNVQQNEQGEYISTKQNHTGIGLKSITDIAQKYNGDVQFTHDNDEFHAQVMIALINNDNM